ncbi:DUF2254 domain-containing protein [Aestuariibacter sp. AA17]|uniref:DUF2254 domain-containing protein n=1 Tax=Fluctibacter corallii TaxID=2984329 RepID=A0ABT3AB00_9ALTE|nr:DUF2254 domain-containing protein [Aestuariibacter sp. AA17]MCV2885848.1 DUF2254 domain-containing protein [Aestuariibacter sp. AA17]
MRIKARALTLIETLRTSFWFVPSCMLLGAVVLAKTLIELDRNEVFHNITLLKFVYESNSDTIVSLLTTLAGSMITVTSIVFSITVLSLSMASQQFGPRLIRHFMADNGTKMVMGTFLATFIYCILVVEVTDEFESRQQVPGMAVYVAVLLSLASIGVLIFYIHHVARTIQADQVISDVHRRLDNTINRLFPSDDDQAQGVDCDASVINEAKAKYPCVTHIYASESGYVQAIDYGGLKQIACSLDACIVVSHLPGNYLVKGAKLLTLHHFAVKASLDHARFEENIVIGSQRTPAQDPEFAVHQLVEIAVRALSPGVNDPYSAIACVDNLSAMMCELTQKTFPYPYLVDDDRVFRVERKPLTFADIGHAAFDQIRQYAKDSVAVTIRLIEGLSHITDSVNSIQQKTFIQEQLASIEQAQKSQDNADCDKEDIFSRIEAVRRKLRALRALDNNAVSVGR